jgi:cell division protein FtsQ
MSEQNKISTKKLARFSIAGLLVVIFLVALFAASASQANRVPVGLDVSIVNENEHKFIYKKDIEHLLKTVEGPNYLKTTISQMDLSKLEREVEKNPWVIKSEVYVDNAARLKVQVTQRVPVARIFNQTGASWYMDSTLKMLPVSASYAYPSPVFTNVPVLNNDTFGNSLKAKIAYLSSVIINDSFWNAQITQIEVQPNQTFVLIPMLGEHKILLGDTSNVRAKLDNLFAFYQNVSTKIGWDKYTVLDARFAGQIVASPAMGYVPPVIKDTAMEAAVALKPEASIKTGTTPNQVKTSDAKSKGAPKIVGAVQKTNVNKLESKTPAKPTQKASGNKAPAKDDKTKGKYIYQGKK